MQADESPLEIIHKLNFLNSYLDALSRGDNLPFKIDEIMNIISD